MHFIFRNAKLALALFFVVIGASLAGSAVDPKMVKEKFEAAEKEAEVVADVRVLSAVCTESAAGGERVTLQLSLHVLESVKGPVKKNDVVVVAYKVRLPSGNGLPGLYGFTGAVRQFPFTPGVKGNVALNRGRSTGGFISQDSRKSAQGGRARRRGERSAEKDA